MRLADVVERTGSEQFRTDLASLADVRRLDYDREVGWGQIDSMEKGLRAVLRLVTDPAL